ncbi:MAG: hypothetical protein IRY85_08750 [Micromonosporaceae bacterium]|nr:hypothetical protein [Micromonosporaceae bacterium]
MATVRVRGADALAADALAPIRETLRHMAARPDIPPLTGIEPGLVVTDPAGWVRATELVSGEALDDLLDTAARRWHAAPHAAAALAFKCYSYWLALPAVLGYATVRRVPLLTPDAVLVRWSAERPFLRLGLASARRSTTAGGRGTSGPGVTVAVLPSDPVLLYGQGRGIRVVPNEAALLDELRAAIMDEHLAPILDHIRSRRHVGRRTLWGSLAAGVAHGLSRAADVIPGSTLQAAQAVLASLDIADLVEVTQRPDGPELTVNRRTCCLAFTLPEPQRKVCAGCCIRESAARGAGETGPIRDCDATRRRLIAAG